MRQWPKVGLVLSVLVGTQAAVPVLRAELILDDFDDPVEVVTPEMLGDSVITEGVGMLNANRTFRIAASTVPATPPLSSLDSGVTSPSLLTAHLLDPGARINGSAPLFAFQFDYKINPTDVTQGGVNDSILFDFAVIQGNSGPDFLRVIVTDDTNVGSRFETSIFDLPLSSGPLVAAMPFSSFTLRGGSPGLPDFTTIKQLNFDFFFLRPGRTVQWSAEIERIRFSRIPEPSSLALWQFAGIILARRIRCESSSCLKGGS